MSLPNRISAYEDCFTAFDTASVSGARFQFIDYGQAHYFCMRCNQARALQREESKRMYAPTDRQWNKSEYDRLSVRMPVQDSDGKWWTYIEPYEANILAAEQLGGDSGLLPLRQLQLAASSAAQLEPPHETLTIEGTIEPSE